MSLLSNLNRSAFRVLQRADPVTFTFEEEDYSGVLNRGARLAHNQLPEGYDPEQASVLYVDRTENSFTEADMLKRLTIDAVEYTIAGIEPYEDKAALILGRRE